VSERGSSASMVARPAAKGKFLVCGGGEKA
jgi:hypothetical protein